MNRNKRGAVLIALFYLQAAAFCENLGQYDHVLEDLFSPETARELRQTGKIQFFQFNEKEIQYRLFPQTEIGNEAKSVWSSSSAKPVLVVESLYYLEKKNPTIPGAEIERISRIIRSASKMTGLKYYSNTRKKEQVLYPESFTINNEVERKKIPDNLDGNPDGRTAYMFQTDSSFGSYIYKILFRQAGLQTCFMSENLDHLMFAFFKVVAPGEMKISLIINDCGPEIAVYLLVQAKFVPFTLLEQYLTKSFTARTDALFSWFKQHYEGEEIL